MEHEKSGKRPLALPITLVILVLSLMGNVLLYTLHLQHTQEARYDEGQDIYRAAVESKLYVDELSAHVDAVLGSKATEDRLEAKYGFGRAAVLGTGVIELVAHAERYSEEEGANGVEKATLFVNNVDAALRQVGNYGGPLKEKDLAYLNSLKATLEEMAGALGGINTNLSDNRAAITRLSSGLEWPAHAVRLLRLLEEKPSEYPA
ncbi:hypothetical protein [Paenibacillus arenilitoris]|uniref:Uncharacterized protein n=1 Tax=Paenibacillus arenilitoris TaxID=2772299 RepID=A0A927CL72_9BACL|nr:hypothetical protein [Paenibacillus arenilitoris]MBD2869475.1 hypothetical protein [Paenibacillus arenilitoris]